MAAKKSETAKATKPAMTPATTGLRKGVKPAAAKVAARRASAPKAAKAASKRAAQETPERLVVPSRAQDVIPVEPKPSARTCPLVLDGITAPEDFSPRDCFACDEFDCRFNAVEESSSVLGSRLFAADDGDDGLGDDDDHDSGFGGFYEDADVDNDDGYDDMR
ncbi:MAG: hypothetical protein FWH21_08190 [Kiritimatiellaeota bacterium]|nr:hypothetical protein [Kiritimatiellota bacterium]